MLPSPDPILHYHALRRTAATERPPYPAIAPAVLDVIRAAARRITRRWTGRAPAPRHAVWVSRLNTDFEWPFGNPR